MYSIAKGNRAYQSCNWSEALNCYSEAYKVYPELCHIVTPLLDRAILQLVRAERNIADKDYNGENLATRKGRRILFSMIRDEIDILGDWLQHVLCLFDEIHVIDHLSVDGTREKLINIASCHPSLRVYLYDQPEYYQAELINYLVSHCAAPYESDDWCFFLDADEFLVFPNQTALNALLSSEFSAIRLPWRNLVPLVDQPEARPFERSLLQSTRKGNLSKIAFAPTRFPMHSVRVDQGAHNLVHEGSPIDACQCPAEFWLAHYPIRSSQQFIRKLKNGTKAYAAISREKINDQGWHWGQYSLDLGQVNWSVLQNRAYYYSELDAPATIKEVDSLIKYGATLFHRDFIYFESRQETVTSAKSDVETSDICVDALPKFLLTVSRKSKNDLKVSMAELK